MLRLCLSGGFRRFLPLTLEEGYMSQFQQQRSIRTTIPSHYRKISEIIEDELIRIKSSAAARDVFPCLQNSTTTMENLPSSRPRHCKLPAELNQQIYLCFNPTTQRKFIYGLGWNFYAMFRQKLLTKTRRLRNPHGNRWNRTTTTATVAADGLTLNVSKEVRYPKVFAELEFPISGPYSRIDEFPGTILYYYEVKGHLWSVGLSDGDPVSHNSTIRDYTNSYSFPTPNGTGHSYYHFCLAGEYHRVELSEGAILPRRERNVNVYGCGIVLDPDDKLSIFFTMNGKLCGWKIPISPTVDRLFPTVRLDRLTAIGTNFGDDPAKPFEYDIKNCPGLELDCI